MAEAVAPAGDGPVNTGTMDESKVAEMDSKIKELGLFFGQVHDRNLKAFKLLNSVCLPVRYSEQFYKDLLKTPDEVTKMGAFGVRHVPWWLLLLRHRGRAFPSPCLTPRWWHQCTTVMCLLVASAAGLRTSLTLMTSGCTS